MTEELFNLKSTLELFILAPVGVVSNHHTVNSDLEETARSKLCQRYPAKRSQHKQQRGSSTGLPALDRSSPDRIKTELSLLPSPLCSVQQHLDVKALCPGRLAETSSYNTLPCRVSEGSFQAGEAGSAPKEPCGATFPQF